MKKDQIQGVSVRGADGNLYFIPSNNNGAYRLSETQGQLVATNLPQGADIASAATNVPMPACFITVDEGAAKLSDDLASAATNVPMPACMLTVDEGAAKLSDDLASAATNVPMPACMLTVDEGAAAVA